MMHSPPPLDTISSSSSTPNDIHMQRRRSSNLSSSSTLSESMARPFMAPPDTRFLTSLKEEEDTMQLFHQQKQQQQQNMQHQQRMASYPPASSPKKPPQHQQKQQQQPNNNSKPPLATPCQGNALSNDEMHHAVHQFLTQPYDKWRNEMSVTIMTSRVAQKSYGTEKRFLCPPPIILLYGAHWWSVDAMDASALQPPNMQLHMSSDTIRGDMLPLVPNNQIEWSTASGQCWNRLEDLGGGGGGGGSGGGATMATTTATPDAIHSNEPIIAGKCVSKNMYISDSDDKRKAVNMLVHLSLANGRDLDPFQGRDVRVISKPSKKRQTVKNLELCIHHGSVISLFNRIRSQTISTRYLGVAKTNGESVPVGMAQQQSSMASDAEKAADVYFTSRTQTWDPFLIWIVDGQTRTLDNPRRKATSPSLSPADQASSSSPSNSPGSSSSSTRSTPKMTLTHWPPPPAIALPRRDASHPLPVYYNQPVVLQCLSTGLVSPVMIIRKVDNGTYAQGCLHAPANHETTLGGEYHDELLGDPVSQLHKVAFQIVADPTSLTIDPQQYEQLMKHAATTTSQVQTPPVLSASSSSSSSCLPTPPPPPATLPLAVAQATYLSCMKNIVGIYRTTGVRQPILAQIPQKPVSAPNTSPMPPPLDPAYLPTLFSTQRPPQAPVPTASASASSFYSHPYAYTSALDDPHHHQQHQQHQHKRRVSVGGDRKASRVVSGRRRFSSSSDTFATDIDAQAPPNFTPQPGKRRRNTMPSTINVPTTSIVHHWQEEISETCLWTIVNTDMETYTFRPEMLEQPLQERGPAPSMVQPVPTIRYWEWVGDDGDLVLYGNGFTRDMVIFFGTTMAIMRNIGPDELQLAVPHALTSQRQQQQWPMLIVRTSDGMIYNTQCYLDLTPHAAH
ncbi:hypothetical protein BC940DRAFT_304063 [Gongronella butleri]|nr:hypothetical protein BC940DRAFT_304063 [Gongronella butleri]